MAQANLRVAAGIGVVAAFILVGGPTAAVAIADQGGSHGGHSNNGKGSNSGVHGGDGAPWSKVGSGRDAGTSDGRPGSEFSPNLPGQQFKPPKVTFGDGRTPGIQNHNREPRWGGNAPEPAPPPPPPPPPPVIAPTPPPNQRSHEPPVIRQLVVAPTSALDDPFFGLAGLLLIPAAGAILGYRQARAAQDAEKLRRS